ncbi:hypothetical protein [Rhodococcus sp. NPDC003348]
MSIAVQLDQLLADSRERLCIEIHSGGSAARAYARSLWALEGDLRALADRLTTGVTR